MFSCGWNLTVRLKKGNLLMKEIKEARLKRLS